jgi:hypothetical protein
LERELVREDGFQTQGPGCRRKEETNKLHGDTVFLSQALAKGELDTGDKRQKVAELFAIERKVIDTWQRNNKGKKSKDGE